MLQKRKKRQIGRKRKKERKEKQAVFYKNNKNSTALNKAVIIGS